MNGLFDGATVGSRRGVVLREPFRSDSESQMRRTAVKKERDTREGRELAERSISTTFERILLGPVTSQFPGNSHNDLVLVIGRITGKFGPAVLGDVNGTGSSDPSRVKTIGNVHLELSFGSSDDSLKSAVGFRGLLVIATKVFKHHAYVGSESVGIVIVRISAP